MTTPLEPNPPRTLLQGRFTFLDGLRGLAALSVVIFHFNNPWVSPVFDRFNPMLPSWLASLWQHLDLGVEIFFVLSGFVIAHSLIGREITAGFSGNFILRRSIRLDPPYWVTIALCIGGPYLIFPTLLDGFFEAYGAWRGIVINMFYLPDILGPKRIVPVAWTLCLEVQFYLAYLGLLFAAGLITRRARPEQLRRLVPLVVLPFVVLTLASLAYWYTVGRNVFLGRWWMFAAGVAIYFAVRERWRVTPVLIALALLLTLGIARDEPRSVMIAVTGATIYLVAIAGKLQTWLDGPVVQYFGRISYSLYLVHMVTGVAAIGVIKRFGDASAIATVTALLVGVLVSIVSADLLYRFVEAPAANLSRRLRPTTPRTARPEVHPKAPATEVETVPVTGVLAAG